jgi:hypothetical protein
MFWSFEIPFKTVYLDLTKTGYSGKFFWSLEITFKADFTEQGNADSVFYNRMATILKLIK